MVLKDETGITLVELLAAISILSVVILLAGSIHMFGQRQFISETESASQSNDLSYALTVMSTDLRKQSSEDVKVENNEITIINGAKYFLDNDVLKKDSEVLAESVNSFTPLSIGDGVKITITGTNQNASDKKYETTIYFRGEE